jgi:hypothetical protein
MVRRGGQDKGDQRGGMRNISGLKTILHITPLYNNNNILIARLPFVFKEGGLRNAGVMGV